MHVDLLAEEVALRSSRRPYVSVVVTWTRPPASTRVGDRALVTDDGRLIGWVGGACSEAVVIKEARTAIADGQARTLHIGPAGHVPLGREGVVTVPMACASEGEIEVFVQPHQPAARLVAVGRAPMLEALVEMAAAVAFETDLVERGDQGAVFLPALSPRDAVVVATFGHYDEDALTAAVASGAGYVGLVASAKRAATVLEALRRVGVDDERLAHIHAPAGLDLGRISHAQIAVAVLAEIVSQVSQRSAATVGPRAESPIMIDPVCGMSVDPATAADRFTHNGADYYFCAAGCRRAFEADPERFLAPADT